MKEIRMESIERRNTGFCAVGCEKGKKPPQATTPISDHAGIILMALDDYRRWFSENENSDKETIKLMDDAIEFVQCA